MYGKILAINEKSDSGHESLSRQPRYIRSRITTFREMETNTGLHHGFLFKALDAWINPTRDWIYR
ncbi:MAG TPA: hypothetical protein VM802_02715 [Chitinophaga sp.]|uniref:hypothetical protein n=1 Tax=Chitinophaga sp. TaxID=1869181 RepID=UPI002CF97E4D|nr:hypothetical protein [Chitinophaga sp.]HVI43749.1 hypothetical protein [Chitinophaga sp.]